MAMYDATRGTWRIKPPPIEEFPYALAVHESVVREVYRIGAWLPAGSSLYTDAVRRDGDDRREFVGKIAEPSVRDLYRFRSVAGQFAKGDQNPVRYFRARRK